MFNYRSVHWFICYGVRNNVNLLIPCILISFLSFLTTPIRTGFRMSRPDRVVSFSVPDKEFDVVSDDGFSPSCVNFSGYHNFESIPTDVAFIILAFLPTLEVMLTVSCISRLYHDMSKHDLAYTNVDLTGTTWIGRVSDTRYNATILNDETLVSILPRFHLASSIRLSSMPKLTVRSSYALAHFAITTPFVQLKSLSLNASQFLDSCATVSLITSLPHLTSLDLGNARELDMSFFIPLFSSDLPLTRLTLAQHSFDIGPLLLLKGGTALSRLEYLDMSFCVQMNDLLLGWFLSATHYLRYLDLSSCIRLTSSSLEAIAMHCPHMKTLLLARCDLVDTTTSLAILAQCCPGLETLALPHRSANYASLSTLKNFHELRLVKLAIGARSLANQFNTDALVSTLQQSPLLTIELNLCAIVHQEINVSELQSMFDHRLINTHNCADHGGYVGSGMSEARLQRSRHLI